jgi:hypothetical protein
MAGCGLPFPSSSDHGSASSNLTDPSDPADTYDPFFDAPQKPPDTPLVPIYVSQGKAASAVAYPTDLQRSPMTFFVTSAGSGSHGGNLGGLAGADTKCELLAEAVGAGDHTWHAYLSAAGVDARDRIGAGPWRNHGGQVVAPDVAALHDPARAPDASLLLDEKGNAVPASATAILTGTGADGTALTDTCRGWTSSSASEHGHVGDAAAAPATSGWNDAAQSPGCSSSALAAAFGEGRLYCFAID